MNRDTWSMKHPFLDCNYSLGHGTGDNDDDALHCERIFETMFGPSQLILYYLHQIPSLPLQ